MMPVLLSFAVVMSIVGANLWAVRLARPNTSSLHRWCLLSGLAGIALVPVLGLAVLDGFSQIWVARPGYAAWPILLSFVGLVCATTSSLALAVTIRRARPLGASRQA